jgi:hypothetical protein
MDRRSLFVSPIAHISSLILIVSLGFSLIDYLTKEIPVKRFSIPTIDHIEHHVYYRNDDYYTLIIPGDGKMHVQFLGDKEDEYKTLGIGWEQNWTEDLTALKKANPIAPFFLQINSNYPFKKIEWLLQSLQKEAISRVYLIGNNGFRQISL